MSIPGPLLPCRVEQGLVSSLLPRPQQLQEESGPVRIGKGANEKPSKTTASAQKGIPAGIGRDGLAKAPAGQLTRLFSGLLQAGGTSLGTVRLLCWQAKTAKRWPSKTIPGPKALLPRPCEGKSSVPVGGRIREFAKEWMDITQDPFVLGTIQGHLLQFNQKPP